MSADTSIAHKMDQILDKVLYLLAVVHILGSPYTKVEESFNLQVSFGYKNIPNIFRSQSLKIVNSVTLYRWTYKRHVLCSFFRPFGQFERAVKYIQGGALNRGLFFADPPPSLLGAVSGNISEIH